MASPTKSKWSAAHARAPALAVVLRVATRCWCVAAVCRIASRPLWPCVPCARLRPCSIKTLQDDIYIGDSPLGTHGTSVAIRVLGFLQTATSTIIVILFFVNFGKLSIQHL